MTGMLTALHSRTPIGRALRVPLRLLPRGLVVPVLSGPGRGALWVTGSSVHGCWLGLYERDKQLAIAAELGPGDVFYDVGANVGFYTVLVSRLVGPRGRVCSFEPLPRNAAALKRHVRLNRLANVEVFEVAVCDREGEVCFDPSEHSSMGHISDSGPLCVRAEPIDRLVADGRIRPPSCVKLDVEGAELSALEGAVETLRRHAPTLFVATHGSEVHAGVLSFLADYGYSVVGLAGAPVTATDELVARPYGSQSGERAE